MKELVLTWEDVFEATQKLIHRLLYFGHYDLVLGVGNGGIIPSLMVASILARDWGYFSASHYDGKQKRDYVRLDEEKLLRYIEKYRNGGIIVVDDIYDTGETMGMIKEVLKEHKKYGFILATVYSKVDVKDDVIYGVKIELDVWVRFPWEQE